MSTPWWWLRNAILMLLQADFARSGASDFQGFVLSDFFGAGFFHLLLGLVLAALLGSLGAAIGRLIRPRFRVA